MLKELRQELPKLVCPMSQMTIKWWQDVVSKHHYKKRTIRDDHEGRVETFNQSYKFVLSWLTLNWNWTIPRNDEERCWSTPRGWDLPTLTPECQWWYWDTILKNDEMSDWPNKAPWWTKVMTVTINWKVAQSSHNCWSQIISQGHRSDRYSTIVI